jgi:hypothetical protein
MPDASLIGNSEHVAGDRRLARCWTKLTRTPVVITMWQPQVWRDGMWYLP